MAPFKAWQLLAAAAAVVVAATASTPSLRRDLSGDVTVTAKVWGEKTADGFRTSGEKFGVQLGDIPVTLFKKSQLPDKTWVETSEVLSIPSGVASVDFTIDSAEVRKIKLHFAQPSGTKWTKKDGNTLNVVNKDGETGWINVNGDSEWNAGLVLPGSASIYTFSDRNQNGDKDSGEPRVAGVHAALQYSDGTAVVYPAWYSDSELVGKPVKATSATDGLLKLNFVPSDVAVKIQFGLPVAGSKFTKFWKGFDNMANLNGVTQTFSASVGEQSHTGQVGIILPGKARYLAFSDKNLDGLRKSESAVVGAVGHLMNKDKTNVLFPADYEDVALRGKPVSGTSGSDGVVELAWVPADVTNMYVQFELKQGQRFTGKLEADQDGNVVRTTGISLSISLETSEQVITGKVAYVLPGRMEITAFSDKNADGLRKSEGALVGMTAALVYASGGAPVTRPTDNTEVTGTSSSDGKIVFDWVGYVLPGKMEILAFSDTNDDGNKTGSDPALEGATASLFYNSDKTAVVNPGTSLNVVGTSGADGKIQLDWVPADAQVFVKFDLPEGWRFANKPKYAQTMANVNNGQSAVIYATNGEQAHSGRVGFVLPGTLAVRAFSDLDGDGRKDGNEPGVEDVQIQLFLSNGTPVNRPGEATGVVGTTDQDGRAILDYVPATRGLKFKVKFTIKDGFAFGPKGDSSLVSTSGWSAVYELEGSKQEIGLVQASILVPGKVKASMWNEKDGGSNVKRQSDEERLPCDEVFLLEANNSPMVYPDWHENAGDRVQGSTDEEGFVELWAPANRAFKVKLSKPEGSRFADNAGIHSSSGVTKAAIRPSKSSQLHEVSAGVLLPGELDVRVFTEGSSPNGQFNANKGDAGLEKIQVKLYEANGRTALRYPSAHPRFGHVSGRTDEDGKVLLEYVPTDRDVVLRVFNLGKKAYKPTVASLLKWNKNSFRSGRIGLTKGSQRLQFDAAFLDLNNKN
ncbi:Uncharacterized protein SCF082_LOCUS49643 [Durusdinium trenchii]|uniref:Uncharacterized protein n=1 Tax=Durusdinium trenchii TaxID=1381693 RepID=A0ABP0S2L3_9DINO